MRKIECLQIDYITAQVEDVINRDEGTFDMVQKAFLIGWSANIGYGTYSVWVGDDGKVTSDDEGLGEEFLDLLLPLIPDYFKKFATATSKVK